jgi:hypothetical protein
MQLETKKMPKKMKKPKTSAKEFQKLAEDLAFKHTQED